MYFYRISYKTIQLFFFFVTLLSFSSARGQPDSDQEQHPIFQGKYLLTDSLLGTVKFEYRLLDSDTLKDGKFTFQRFDERYQESDSTDGLLLTGIFHNNIKNGPWHYAAKQFAISGGAQALGAQIVYNASGSEFFINANFQGGRVDGDYEIVHRYIAESRPTDTTFYSKLEFHYGAIGEHLVGFTDRMKVEGRFDAEGFPNGPWIFTHKIDSGRNLEEYRDYDHGFFSRHYYKIDNKVVEIKHIGFDTMAVSGKGLLTRFPANRAYFRALNYTNTVMDTTAISGIVNIDSSGKYISHSNDFLQRVFTRPATHNDRNVWQLVNGSDSVPRVRVKVSKFSFSEEEVLRNKDNEKILTETKSLIEDFFANPNTQVGRFANETLSFYYEVLGIYRKRLEQISPVISLLADEASEYVDHDAILAYNAVDITYPDKVPYVFQERQHEKVHAFPSDLTTFRTNTLNTHLTAVFKDVSAIVTETENTLEDYQAQSDLRRDESELIALRDSINNLFSNTNELNSYNKLHSGIKDAIREFTERSFKTYAALGPYERSLKIDTLKACYLQYLDLYNTLVRCYEQMAELDKEYTRSIWNPYTFTYMDERVKERLYKAYEDVLFPFLWKELQDNLSCGTFEGKLRNIGLLQEKMAELRLQDTKELEKEIRRARENVDVYLEILNLDLDI